MAPKEKKAATKTDSKKEKDKPVKSKESTPEKEPKESNTTVEASVDFEAGILFNK